MKVKFIFQLVLVLALLQLVVSRRVRSKCWSCSSIGDPHLRPVNGRRFDDFRAGWHTFYQSGSTLIRYYNSRTKRWGNKRVMSKISVKCGTRSYTYRTGGRRTNKVVRCNGVKLTVRELRSRNTRWFNIHLNGCNSLANAHGTCVHRNKRKIPRRHRSWTYIRKLCGKHYRKALSKCRSKKNCVIEKCKELKRFRVRKCRAQHFVSKGRRCYRAKNCRVTCKAKRSKCFKCSSAGDPHVSPVKGRRFDDYRAGWHTFYKNGRVNVRYYSTSTRRYGNKRVMSRISFQCGSKTQSFKTGGKRTNKVLRCDGVTLRVREYSTRGAKWFNIYLNGCVSLTNAHGTCIHRNKRKIVRRHRSWTYIRKLCGKHYRVALRKCRSRKNC